MITTRFYLDARQSDGKRPAQLKVVISKNGKSAMIPLCVALLPSQWDRKAEKVVNHPNRSFLNVYVTRMKLNVDSRILDMLEKGEAAGMDAYQIRDVLRMSMDGSKNDAHLFSRRLRLFADRKENSGTKGLYYQTLRKIQLYTDAETLTFEEMTREWLYKFEAFLAKTQSKNARNIHLRNIRAVFNDALDDNCIKVYPFRKFKIRPEETRKRSLSADEIRMMQGRDMAGQEYLTKYRDMFMLIFYLCGINITDLCHLRHNSLSNGRIEYRRAKTKRLYSIKVEPEAMEIIGRYRGEGYLLDIMDNYSRHSDFTQRMNRNLKRIGSEDVGKRGRKTVRPLFPELTTYWARHTWATVAAELDIPKETIAAALGHGGNSVTDIYIRFNNKKIDDANRRVIDYVLYGRRRREV